MTNDAQAFASWQEEMSTDAQSHDVSVLLTFDVDAWSGWMAIGTESPSVMSRGEFAGPALKRLLRLLERRKIEATFFVPGYTAKSFPRLVEAIVKGGHEVALHGNSHRSPVEMTEAEEREELEVGKSRIAEIAGRWPCGYRAPSWELSCRSVDLLIEQEFTYDSSMMASDIEPYWARSGDAWSADKIRFGQPVELVELPIAWHRDDVPLFEYMFAGQLRTQGGTAPSSVAEIWLGDFDYLYNIEREGMLVYTMHPEVIGHGHRLLMLEAILDRIQSLVGVRFVSCLEYANQWKALRTPELPDFFGSI